MECDISQSNKINKGSYKFLYGMPFFRNDINISCLDNKETVFLKQNDRIINEATKIIIWTNNDKGILKKSILKFAITNCKLNTHQLLGEVGKTIANHVIPVNETSSTEITNENSSWILLNNLLDYTEYNDLSSIIKLIKDFHNSDFEINWWEILRDSCLFEHTFDECQGLWNTELKPNWSQEDWSIDELNKLNNVALTYGKQDWDNIARCFSNRSAFQCFQKYQCVLKYRICKTSWTKFEDQILLSQVAICRIGEFISWNEVSLSYIHRTKAQIYNRYTNWLLPKQSLGNFTKQEDEELIKVIKDKGNNFKKIPGDSLKGRSKLQMKHRYKNLLKYHNLRRAKGSVTEANSFPVKNQFSYTNSTSPSYQ